MSYEDLEHHGFILPKDQWDKRNMRSTVNPWLMGFAALVAGVSVILMIAGAGRMLTWIGAGLFPCFLALFLMITSRAIKRRTRQLEERGADPTDAPD